MRRISVPGSPMISKITTSTSDIRVD
jgi:hypothetical protein